jgi:hypothetical protein
MGNWDWQPENARPGITRELHSGVRSKKGNGESWPIRALIPAQADSSIRTTRLSYFLVAARRPTEGQRRPDWFRQGVLIFGKNRVAPIALV